MHDQQKIIRNRLALFIFVCGLITACNINIFNNLYVQDIVPAQQEPAVWYLSPIGDKLLYDTASSRKQAIVRFLTTGQEFNIVDCTLFRWLNNDRIFCYDFRDQYYRPPVVIDVSSNTSNFQKPLIKEVTTEQVELELLLKRAKAIYRLYSLSRPDTLLVLDTEPQKNITQYYHVIGIENLDKVLENYTYTTIPLFSRGAELSKKIYSPNKKHYYLLQDNLRIYDATNDQVLAEFEPPSNYESYFQIGGDFPNKSEGWASDSSGVYFRIAHSVGFFGLPNPIRAIQKLCVPDIEGCTSPN